MRVAYFINQYPKTSHSFIRREIVALEARGHEVCRYALASSPGELVDPADLAEQASTRHLFHEPPLRLAADFAHTALLHPLRMLRALATALRMGWRSDRGLPRHLAYWVEAAIVAAWCARDRAQHLHAHFGTNSAAVALLVNRISGLAYSFTVHGPDEFDRPEFIALGRKIEAAAFVVAISSYGRSQLMRWAAPEHWPKIAVVHCGLDAEFRDAAPLIRNSASRLVCVGRLGKEKGHLILIDAVAKLRDDGVPCELVLVGDGPLRSAIEQRIAALGLQDQVSIKGWLPGARVREEIARARALVLPSFSEGLPVVIMEAMALRRPVIATTVGGVPELVRDGETGWLVPAGDVAALAAAMVAAMAAAPETIAAMGEAARRRVLTRHNVDREVEKLEALMQSAIGGGATC